MIFLKKFEKFNKEEYHSVKNKTYIFGIENYTKMRKEGKIYEKIINYDISNFRCDDNSYGIYFYPDSNFIKLIEELNKYNDKQIPLNISFDLSIDSSRLNLIDSSSTLPKELQNLGLGYKLYKEVIKRYGYITSTKAGTKENALRIWYNLMFDYDLYCYTSLTDSGAILKTYIDIKNVLDQLKSKNLEFDSELKQKIIELYGSLENYKNV